MTLKHCLGHRGSVLVPGEVDGIGAGIHHLIFTHLDHTAKTPFMLKYIVLKVMTLMQFVEEQNECAFDPDCK
jgi:hypothetical protein